MISWQVSPQIRNWFGEIFHIQCRHPSILTLCYIRPVLLSKISWQVSPHIRNGFGGICHIQYREPSILTLCYIRQVLLSSQSEQRNFDVLVLFATVVIRVSGEPPVWEFIQLKSIISCVYCGKFFIKVLSLDVHIRLVYKISSMYHIISSFNVLVHSLSLYFGYLQLPE